MGVQPRTTCWSCSLTVASSYVSTEGGGGRSCISIFRFFLGGGGVGRMHSLSCNWIKGTLSVRLKQLAYTVSLFIDLKEVSFGIGFFNRQDRFQDIFRPGDSQLSICMQTMMESKSHAMVLLLSEWTCSWDRTKMASKQDVRVRKNAETYLLKVLDGKQRVKKNGEHSELGDSATPLSPPQSSLGSLRPSSFLVQYLSLKSPFCDNKELYNATSLRELVQFDHFQFYRSKHTIYWN